MASAICNFVVRVNTSVTFCKLNAHNEKALIALRFIYHHERIQYSFIWIKYMLIDIKPQPIVCISYFMNVLIMMAFFPLHLALFPFRSIHAISNDNIKFVTTTTATTVLRLSHNSLFLFVFFCFVYSWENKASLCRYAVCGDCNILNIPHAVAWITHSST